MSILASGTFPTTVSKGNLCPISVSTNSIDDTTHTIIGSPSGTITVNNPKAVQTTYDATYDSARKILYTGALAFDTIGTWRKQGCLISDTERYYTEIESFKCRRSL